MDEDDGLAAVELGVELVLVGMAEMTLAGVAQQADAVELERIERVDGLLQLIPGPPEGATAQIRRTGADDPAPSRQALVTLARHLHGEIDIAKVCAG